MSDWITGLLILLTFLAWLAGETYLIITGQPTESATIFKWYVRFRPLGFLFGLGMGILGAHWFFPAGCL